jgi:two-component system, sensor histidine kinase and response regulator
MARKILVVDDSPDILFFCETVLRAVGYEVATAADGVAGMAALEAGRPDLLILDVMMEEVDTGFKLAHRAAALYPDLAIVLLSSLSGPAPRVFDTSDLPVRDMLEKPVSPETLVARVRKIIG